MDAEGKPIGGVKLFAYEGAREKPGRRVAFAEGEVCDDQGKVVATASSACLVFPG